MTPNWPPRAGGPKSIIGMVHLRPLPGAPLASTPLDVVVKQALADAQALEQGGIDALLVQNRGDRAFPANHAPPDVIAAMGAVVYEVVRQSGIPVGVHVLRNDTQAGIAIAHAAGAQFVRAAVLTGVSASAQGMLTGNPYELLRYRHAIGADAVALYADVLSMHNRTPLEEAPEMAAEAVFFGAADAVVIAHPATEEMLALARNVRAKVKTPILLGGYVTAENGREALAEVDGAMVGGAFEVRAREAGVDVELVRQFITRVRG